MDSIHVQQKLRPMRYAFLIKEADLGAALKAVSLNSVIWGGVYNPIIPTDPRDECFGLLSEFDPDKLVDLTSGHLGQELQEKYQHRIISGESLVSTDGHRGVKKLCFGFTVLPLLRHIYEKEARFLSGPSRAAIISCPPTQEWPNFVAFQFGSFEYLPETTLDFKDHFLKALRAQEIAINLPAAPENLEDKIPPIQITAYGLSVFGGSASFSSHVIYIGNHHDSSDLIEFWNIRATGRSCIFVPVDSYRSFETMIRNVAASGRYQVNPEIENQADLQKGPTISDEIFAKVCDWIGSLNLGALPRRHWRPRFGVSFEHYVGDIHVSEIEAQSGEEISLLEGSRMTPVKLVEPEYLGEHSVAKGDYEWAVEIGMMGGWQNDDFIFSFPNEPEVEKAITYRGFFRGPEEVRIGRRGVVVMQDYRRNNLYLSPIRTKDVFFALFAQAKLSADLSLPGRYMEQIIKKMGDLLFDCRILKLRGVRDVINRLSNGSILTKGNMNDIVMSTTHDRFGQNWLPELYERTVVKKGQGDTLNFSTIFAELLDKKVIRPGFTLRCENCFAEGWYHVSEFNEEYTCRYCFSRQRVNFASKAEWQYKADGLFQIRDSAQGSIAGIVSLWRLHELRSLDDSRHVCSLKLRETVGNREYEIDYAYLSVGGLGTAYEFVLGQAKNFVDFTEHEIQAMGSLAQRFSQKPYLCFATLKDSFSQGEKDSLNALVAAKQKVIALTRLELDPYHLYERFEAAPHKYANSLEDISSNTIYLNLR